MHGQYSGVRTTLNPGGLFTANMGQVLKLNSPDKTAVDVIVADSDELILSLVHGSQLQSQLIGRDFLSVLR